MSSAGNFLGASAAALKANPKPSATAVVAKKVAPNFECFVRVLMMSSSDFPIPPPSTTLSGQRSGPIQCNNWTVYRLAHERLPGRFRRVVVAPREFNSPSWTQNSARQEANYPRCGGCEPATRTRLGLELPPRCLRGRRRAPPAVQTPSFASAALGLCGAFARCSRLLRSKESLRRETSGDHLIPNS